MGGVLGTEVPALYRTGIALTLGRARHIYHLDGLKDAHAQLGPRRKLCALALCQTELPQAAARCGPCLCEVTGLRLRHAASTALAGGDLNRAIAILLGIPDLRDPVGAHFNHGDRNAGPIFREDAGHAGFPPYDSNGHGTCLSRSLSLRPR